MLPFFFVQDAAFPTTFRTRPPSHHALRSKIPTFFPHFFHPFTSLPVPVSLLFDHSSAAAQSCPISVSLSLSSSLHSPPTIFTDFSNMSFRRLLPPVSWGRRAGLLKLLVGKLFELSGTSYYNDAANNGSFYISVLPLLLRNSSWLPPPSTVSSRCCKNTHSHQWWVSTEPRCHERSMETKKAGWYCNCEWIMPLNWLS